VHLPRTYIVIFFLKKIFFEIAYFAMSSLNSSPGDTNALNGSFQCAAGVYCLLPLVNYADSCHRCFFCKGTLHGPCGVLHDPDNIAYQNGCNYVTTNPMNDQLHPMLAMHRNAPYYVVHHKQSLCLGRNHQQENAMQYRA
jgi:hypothetical protein